MSCSDDTLLVELKEILDSLPKRYDPVLAASISGPCEFRLSGDLDRSFHLICAQGAIKAVEGRHAEPTSVVTIDAKALVDVCLHRVGLEDLVNSGTVGFTGRVEDLMSASFMLFMPPERVAQRFEMIETTWAKLPMMEAIPQTAAPSRSELFDAARFHRPLLMKQVLRGWAAAAWTPALLAQEYGHLKLVSDAREATIATFLEEAKIGGGSNVSASTKIPAEMHSELCDTFFQNIPTLLNRTMWNGIHEFFLSMPNASTGLHRDESDGIVTALLAPRRIRFYSPAQAELLYPFSSIASGFQLCHVDPKNPDLAKYPKFGDARCLTVDLAPGDLLFLPGGWFHHVTALDTSIALKMHFIDEWSARL